MNCVMQEFIKTPWPNILKIKFMFTCVFCKYSIDCSQPSGIAKNSNNYLEIFIQIRKSQHLQIAHLFVLAQTMSAPLDRNEKLCFRMFSGLMCTQSRPGPETMVLFLCLLYICVLIACLDLAFFPQISQEWVTPVM